MEKFKEHDVVTLSEDREEFKKGSTGTIIHQFEEDWFLVEIFENGKTIGFTPVHVEKLKIV